MNRGLCILLAALVASLVGYFATRATWVAPSDRMKSAHTAGTQMHELEWLRREFGLSEVEFEKVSSLHLAYQPTCETLCTQIESAREKVRGLVLAGRALSPDLDTALLEEATLRARCQSAMLGHLYETAAALPPEKSRAYLDAMLPEVLEMTMDGSPAPSGH